MPSIQIGNRCIGDDEPPVVIAEIGINHEGSIDLAIHLADSAIDAGAEIIKHQTHIVQDEMTDEARQVIPGHTTDSIYDIMDRCSLSEQDEWRLMRHVQARKGIFISTPFSRDAVDRLGKFDVPAIKIGSGECNNYPLIRHAARLKKPIIISTGMNSIESICPSVDILRRHGVPYALLHCTNVYPTPPHLVRLGCMSSLRSSFPDAVIGLSDHTTSIYTCLGAVALGASIVERHFTDRMDRTGPDIPCSMTPQELSHLIDGSKTIFSARGGDKGPVQEESDTIAFAFSSVVSICDIEPGDVLSEQNIWLKRPGGGDFLARDYDLLIGKKSNTFVPRGQQLKRSDVSLE